MPMKQFFAGLSGAAALIACAGAQEIDDGATVSLVFENDFFASDDFNYTNGSKLGYLSPPHDPKGIGRFVAQKIFGMTNQNAYAWHGFAIGQSLYTPEDILATEPLFDQHPYAAYLYGEYTTMVSQENTMTQLTVQLGMVGPSAYGEQTQNLAHDLLDGDKALGWDNQIGDELGLAVTLDRRYRVGMTLGDSDVDIDLLPGWGVTAGNVRTDAHAGMTVRIGENLKHDYGPPRVLPGLRGNSYFVAKPGLSWHAFAGVEGRVVAHDIVIDGSFLDDGDIVTQESQDFVGDIQGGLVLQYGRFQLSYIHVFRDGQFRNSGGSDEFGVLSFAMKTGGRK